MNLTPELRRYFRDELRSARARALDDAEDFDAIVHVVERLGGLLSGLKTLGRFSRHIIQEAASSPLATEIPTHWAAHHLTFERLLHAAHMARNSAVHEGARARQLTVHWITVSIVLEDALMSNAECAGEFMVRQPVTAELWQPLSFIRQVLLTNSFSYLPFLLGSDWVLVSDYSLAQCLNRTGRDRENRLRLTLQSAIDASLLKTLSAPTCKVTAPISDLLADPDHRPFVVLDEKNNIVGILTSFDML